MERIAKKIILFIYNTILRTKNSEYYYDIFECPIRNYQRCFEENDSRFLFKKYDLKYKDNLYHVIENMTNKLIDDFGLNPVVEILFFKKRDLIKEELRHIITEDDQYLNIIRDLKKDIESIERNRNRDDNIKESNSRNNRIITQWLGYESTKLSVYDYYVAAKDCQASNKKDNSQYVREKMRKIG